MINIVIYKHVLRNIFFNKKILLYFLPALFLQLLLILVITLAMGFWSGFYCWLYTSVVFVSFYGMLTTYSIYIGDYNRQVILLEKRSKIKKQKIFWSRFFAQKTILWAYLLLTVIWFIIFAKISQNGSNRKNINLTVLPYTFFIFIYELTLLLIMLTFVLSRKSIFALVCLSICTSLNVLLPLSEILSTPVTLLSGKNNQNYYNLEFYYIVDELNTKTKDDQSFQRELDFFATWDKNGDNKKLINNFYKENVTDNNFSWKEMIRLFKNNYGKIFHDETNAYTMQVNDLIVTKEEWEKILNAFDIVWDRYLQYVNDEQNPIDIFNNTISSGIGSELIYDIKSYYVPWWSKIINTLNINNFLSRKILSAKAKDPLDYYLLMNYEQNQIFGSTIDNIELLKTKRAKYTFYTIRVDRDYSFYGIIAIVVTMVGVSMYLYWKRW